MRKTPTPRTTVAAPHESDDRLFSRGGRGVGPALHRMGPAVSLAANGGDALGRFRGPDGDWNGACERGSGFVAA